MRAATANRIGIGLATAARFVEQGAYVFIAARRQAELDKAVAKKGKIDVIVAGPGLVEKMMTAAATPEHFEKTFSTNARGTYFTVQKLLPHE